jgi:hypothetical protein
MTLAHISNVVLQAGKYSSWLPPLSNFPLHDMIRKLRWADKDNKCMRSAALYDAIVCEPG